MGNNVSPLSMEQLAYDDRKILMNSQNGTASVHYHTIYVAA